MHHVPVAIGIAVVQSSVSCHLSSDKVPTQHPVSQIFLNLWSSDLKGMIVLGRMTLI